MDGSLSAIFMDGSLASLPASWTHPGQTAEELQHLLSYASMELESARSAAKAQWTLHEARVGHLEELLKTTRRERDEAREECLKLQETLASCCSAGISSPPGLSEVVQGLPAGLRHDSPARRSLGSDSRGVVKPENLSCNNYMHSSITSSSSGHFQMDSVCSMTEPSRDHFSEVQWKLEDLPELEDQLDLDQRMDLEKHQLDMEAHQEQRSSSPSLQTYQSPSPQHQQLVDQLQHHLQMQQGEELPHKLDNHLAMESPTENSHLSAPPLPLEDSHQFDLEVHEQLSLSGVDVGESQKQESLPQQDQLCLQVRKEQIQEAWVPSLSDSSFGEALSRQSSFSQQYPGSGMCSPTPFSCVGSNIFSPVLQSGSALASLLTPLERFGDSSPLPAFGSRPIHHHLPEPPEADPQVMLKSLPEKGKLLQAVMQAGPLLQTLLLAGPLPQWRHPPPALDTVDIPKVSMPSPVSCLPLSSLPQTPLCTLMPNQLAQSPSLDYVLSLPPMASRHSSPVQAPLTPRTGSPISNLQSSSTNNLCSSSRLLRRSRLYGDVGQDMRFSGPPLKYAKIH